MEDLYSSIFHRKSIRKYDMKPISSEALTDIKYFVNKIEPLEKDIKVEFIYLNAGDVKNILPIRAPHYLCLYSERKGNYLMNAGFMLQQADLFFSSKEIGSCWLGMAKPTAEVPEKFKGLDFVIMLAFGNSLDPVHRFEISEFKRKELEEICITEDPGDILEAVRIAPSASNGQPWFFTGDSKQINIYRVKLGMIKAVLYEKMNKIDIGICLCHLFMAANTFGNKAELVYENNDSVEPKGYEYMVSVKILK